VAVEPFPTLIRTRRRLASELLSAAARHSAIVDELHEIDLMREQRALTPEETERYQELREARRMARHRHDVAARDLKRLMAGARVW
jgi:hypothetical protein